MTRVVVVVVVLATALAACVAGDPDPPGGSGAADGWVAEVVRDDLDGPTQVAAEPRDADILWVAELAGDEDAGAGRVRRLDLASGPDDGVVAAPGLDGLRTPTGVVAVGTEGGTRLVVQEQRRLTSVLLDGGGTPVAASERSGDPLPFNGRSQGTVTALGDGRVLHAATGTGSGPDPTVGSGVLYASDVATGHRTVVASGFKNAYAHAIGPQDELYVTEIGDGTYDGEPPPDELNVLPSAVWRAALDGEGEPYDGGWPRCTGDADPTAAFGATAAECAALPRPVATFAPRATPTSVAVTADGRVLVALWVEDRVVEVDPATGTVSDVLTGVDRPQHLLARDDGTVLVTVHGSGELLRLVPD